MFPRLETIRDTLLKIDYLDTSVLFWREEPQGKDLSELVQAQVAITAAAFHKHVEAFEAQRFLFTTKQRAELDNIRTQFSNISLKVVEVSKKPKEQLRSEDVPLSEQFGVMIQFIEKLRQFVNDQLVS